MASLAPAASAAKKQSGLAPAGEFGIEANTERDQSKVFQRAIDRLAGQGAGLFLPPGSYVAGELEISAPISITGVPGLAKILSGGRRLIDINGTADVTVSGLVLDAEGKPAAGEAEALLSAASVKGLTIEACAIRGGPGNGVSLKGVSGGIRDSTVSGCARTAIFSLDAEGLEIVHNRIEEIGDNGIQVWRSEKGEDGTLVAFNRIERVKAMSGGNGPYGNGINVFRAGNVVVANNRIADCAFSAVRVHSGSNAQVIGNNCSRLDEMAIYVEFAFEGAVVSGNLVEQAASGISITNFDHGGRMAVVANNVMRDLLGARSNPDSRAIGIAVEADTAVTGNVVDNAPHAGLWLGWGYALRNVAATGNVLRDCGIGIAASVSEGAGRSLIANNIISGSRTAAILGMDHGKAATGDLALPGAELPSHLSVSSNLVT